MKNLETFEKHNFNKIEIKKVDYNIENIHDLKNKIF